MVTNMETNELTAERIAEMRRKLANANPRPWKSVGVHASEMIGDAEADAELVAAACNALPDLLYEIERLRGMVSTQFSATFAKLREDLGPWIGSGGGLCEILGGIERMRNEIDRLSSRCAVLERVRDEAARTVFQGLDDGNRLLPGEPLRGRLIVLSQALDAAKGAVRG